MRKKLLVTTVATVSCLASLTAQTNLVPNGSFEIVNMCPPTHSCLSYATGWFNPTFGTSPDLLATCATDTCISIPVNCCGFENPLTGNNYAGIFTYVLDAREYTSKQLSSPLIAGNKYEVRFNVSLADNAKYSISTMGACLTTTVPNGNNDLFAYTPQILNPSSNQLSNKTGWTTIADTFYAAGGELYITIGNFNPTATSDTLFVGSPAPMGWTASYYFIDDVSVVDLGSATSVGQLNCPATWQFAQHILTVQAAGGSFGVEVYNTNGQLIASAGNGNTRAEINFEGLPPGIYVIWIRTEDSEEVIELINY